MNIQKLSHEPDGMIEKFRKRWEKLYSELIIHISGNRLPVPTDSELNEFETIMNFKLPKSYREFCKVFGAGVLADDFRISAPGYLPSTGYSLQDWNEDFQRLLDSDFLQFYSEQAKLQRLIYFASSEPGGMIGWDPQDVRDTRRCEYAIYEIGYQGDLPFRAATFSDFIERYCLGEYIERDDESARAFCPLCG